jgi:hypothetical protein
VKTVKAKDSSHATRAATGNVGGGTTAEAMQKHARTYPFTVLDEPTHVVTTGRNRCLVEAVYNNYTVFYGKEGEGGDEPPTIAYKDGVVDKFSKCSHSSGSALKMRTFPGGSVIQFQQMEGSTNGRVAKVKKMVPGEGFTTYAGPAFDEHVVKFQEANGDVTYYNGTREGDEKITKVERADGRLEFYTGDRGSERLERAETGVRSGSNREYDVWYYRGAKGEEAYYRIERKSRNYDSSIYMFVSFYTGAQGKERLVRGVKGNSNHYLKYGGKKTDGKGYKVSRTTYDGLAGAEALRTQTMHDGTVEYYEGERGKEYRAKLVSNDRTNVTTYYANGHLKSLSMLKVGVYVDEVSYDERGQIADQCIISDTPLFTHELFPTNEVAQEVLKKELASIYAKATIGGKRKAPCPAGASGAAPSKIAKAATTSGASSAAL